MGKARPHPADAGWGLRRTTQWVRRARDPGTAGCASSISALAARTRSATPSASLYDAFDGPPALVMPGVRVREDVDDELGDLVELVLAEAAGGERRGAETDAGGVPGAVGVGGDRVAVGDHAGVEQGRLGLTTGEAERADVEQHEVVVGAAGDQLGAARQEAVGQRLGVVGDAAGRTSGTPRCAPRPARRPWRPSRGRAGRRAPSGSHGRRRARTPRWPGPCRRAGRAATCGWWS